MNISFVQTTFPQRVIFGSDSISQIDDEAERLGASRVMIISTVGQAKNTSRVSKVLGDRVAGIFDKAAMHVPSGLIADASSHARNVAADAIVAVGGGSAIGLGKMVVLRCEMPLLAVPTTYAGSEMTSIYGFTEGGQKKTGRDPRVLPKTVIYDPTLSDSLPPSVSAASGMNAIAHCVEALYATDRNPVVELMAEEAIRALAQSLPPIAGGSKFLTDRTSALYGAWLAASAFAAVSMGLHHKICHVLGGTYQLPHAELHAAVLPHAARFNESAAKGAMERIGRALGGVGDVPLGLFNLISRLGLETKLSALGLKAEVLPEAARLICSAAYPNPAKIDEAGVVALLRAALVGESPRKREYR